MPDQETLATMYGDEYKHFIAEDESHGGEDGVRAVVDELSNRSKGTFLDFGCGGGHLLSEVAGLGWKTYGVEFSPPADEQARGLRIVGSIRDIPPDEDVDVAHFGDVLEHLPDLESQFAAVLERLTPDGIVMVQGPLEANFNLFLLGLRMKKLIRHRDSAMPPYHVTMATAKGQQALFARFELATERFDIFELAHPAPSTIQARDIRNPRATGLYVLRKLSQGLSPLLSRHAGNRFFYVGRKSKT